MVSQTVTVDLNGQWLMKDLTRGVGIEKQVYLPGKVPANCLPIIVPGTVRTALLAAGEIPDPYIGYNNEKSLWVEQKEWWFFKTFQPSPELRGRHVDCVFEGTSFEGEVWLNGQKLGTLKGMLNPHAFDVMGMLVFGKENLIAVRLEAPPDSWANTMARGLTWRTPRDQLYSIAQCMYGWDWGPHCVGIGLWQPVTLRASGPLRIDQPYIRSHIASSAQAVCTITVLIRNLEPIPIEGTIVGIIQEKGSNRKAGEFQQPVKLDPGETREVSAAVAVDDPKLWWPNGMGRQPLYILRMKATVGKVVSEQRETQFGLREVKLVANDRIEEFLKTMKENLGDAHHLGNVLGSYPWTFEINGRKMFAKGGNWIPLDQLLRLDRSRYQHLLRLAKEAHFNLLRVWGGGIYETDDFYDLCDEYGILAWQEFLSNRNFSTIDRESFLDGAMSAVLRLRNHPSLTFWCGGNEFDPDDLGSKAVIDKLEALLKAQDPDREFHRASPYMGDDHYWGVWHGREPYTKYRVVRPFRSEAGINAPPVAENYERFTPESLLWPPDTTYIEYHGESNVRFSHLSKLARYANEFGESATMEDFIRKSQLYQALGNEFDMEFCRSNKFRNSGFLVWQYNDIWPCVSWSEVDWYGTPKPSYYFQKRAARPVHISADYERYLWKTGETFTAEVHLLNDTEERVKGARFAATLLDVNGAVLAKQSGAAESAANISARIGSVSWKIPDSLAGRMFFVAVQLTGLGGGIISDALYPIAVSRTGNLDDYAGIFAEMNRMEAATPQIKIVKPDPASRAVGTLGVRVANPGSALAFFVRVRLMEESDSLAAYYSDNYLSLLPGETKTIQVEMAKKQAGELPSTVHFEVSGWNCAKQTIETDLK